MYNPIDKFNKVKILMQSVVTAITFDLWIDSLKIAEYEVGEEDNTLYLITDSTTAKQQVMQTHIMDRLFECAKTEFNDCTKIVVLDNEEYEVRKKLVEKTIHNNNDSAPEISNSSRFNPKYTFNSFVVGKSNHVVHAAMRGAAENPSGKFNPLFIYGGVGLGKTHLLHAVGNFLENSRPDLSVIYVTCEKFTNDYIETLGSNKESKYAFREKYRKADVLMVDDIQFISNKMGIQEEFFHTFNDLYQSNKQIIIASDRSPKDMSALEERLRSRFSSGLIQDIQVPDYETRVAILSKKALMERYDVEKDVIEYIANKLCTNVREMEGLLAKVVFYASLLNKDRATMSEVEEALKDSDQVSVEKITSDLIMDTVCDFYKISRIDIVGKKKNKEIVEPRQVAVYLINELLNIPLTAIGQLFGGRDHTTIMHARDKITNLLSSNAHLKLKIQDIKAKLTKT